MVRKTVVRRWEITIITDRQPVSFNSVDVDEKLVKVTIGTTEAMLTVEDLVLAFSELQTVILPLATAALGGSDGCPEGRTVQRREVASDP